MSKSLGNGIDPLEVVEQYGADTLRFMLITGNTPGNDMRFYWERVEASRNFANKIWNASRFVLMNLDGFCGAAPRREELTLADRWILSRYQATVAAVTDNLEKFELGEAARLVYEFLWSEYCDWYIEMAKPRLYAKDETQSRAVAQHVLWQVLEGTLRLLHPFMPFITEEIWQHLPHEGLSIMQAPWPQAPASAGDAEAEGQMGLVMEAVKAIRNMRAEMNVPPGRRSEAVLLAGSETVRELLAQNEGYFRQLAAVEPLTLPVVGAPKPENAMAAVVHGVEVYLPLKGLIDVEKETARLRKESEALEKELGRISGKLGNESFIAKAPAAVVEKERAKAQECDEKLAAIRERMAYLAQLA